MAPAAQAVGAAAALEGRMQSHQPVMLSQGQRLAGQ